MVAAGSPSYSSVGPVLIDDLSGDLLDQLFIVLHTRRTVRQNAAFPPLAVEVSAPSSTSAATSRKRA